ncbi:periplasmic binding protein-like I [Polychytrium aggregatum]|uniref:periplasmic binding protein-like I n=1 Tax=Polychytrium aggregatum TaxID=110093 RepID=UPI0022FEA980|nr:periplasmic binding protein-like I [Polychytrium aggregatum]KAI9190857.1 periplasmic binding protein-like I [Polychytrium aggregatum]
MGRSAINITEMAIQDVNSQGILPGITLSAVQFNSLTNQYLAVQNGINLANTSGVVAVIGELFSSVTAPLALTTKAYNLPQCSGSATSPVLSDKSTYTTFLRTLPPDNFQGPAIANFVYANNWRNVIVIYSSDTYGTSLMQAFQAQAQTLGINIQLSQPYNSPASAPAVFSDTANRIQSSGCRIIIFLGYDTDTLLYLQLASSMGMVGPSYVYIGSDGMSTIVSDAQPSDLANLPGFIYLGALENGGNSITQSVISRFQAAYGQTPGADSLFFYDWNVNTVQDIYNRRANLSFANILTTFTGATGQVAFSSNGDRLAPYAVTNLQSAPGGGISAVQTSIIQTDGTVTVLSPTLFFSGSSTPPQDSIAIPQMVMSYSSTSPMVLVIVYSIAAILWVNRAAPIVQKMSLPFLLLINIGLMLSWMSVYAYSGNTTAATCRFQSWVMWIAFSMVFANLFVKVYRIHKIFGNTKMQKLNLSNWILMSGSFGLILVNVIIIIAWNVVDPLSPVRVTTRSYWYLDCQSASSVNQSGFSNALLVYNGILLLGVTYLAYKTRNVAAQFRESNWIAYCGLFIILCGSVVIILLMSSNDYVGTYSVRMWVIALGNFVTYYCLIGRVIVTILSDLVEVGSKTSKHTSSATASATATSQTRGHTKAVQKSADHKRTFAIKIKAAALFAKWESARIKVFDNESIICIYHKKKTSDESHVKSGICCYFHDCLVSSPRGNKMFKLTVGSETFSITMASENEMDEFILAVTDDGNQSGFSTASPTKASHAVLHH